MRHEPRATSGGQHRRHGRRGASADHVGEVRRMAEDPEQVMEEIALRATQVGSVLEGIFREPHGQPRWGVNE